MIDAQRFSVFLSSMENPCSDALLALEEEARSLGIPILRKETQRLLQVVLSMKNPGRILEIGTGVGFSAMFFAEHVSSLKDLVTIENFPPRIEKAKALFAKSTAPIRLLEGDAKDLLPTLPDGRFDFVLMDAAKGQYPMLLPEVKRCMAEGGVLFSDNVLQDGDVLESRFAVTRRDRTIHERMREYLLILMRDPDFTTTILPVEDGVAISVYSGEKKEGKKNA